MIKYYSTSGIKKAELEATSTDIRNTASKMKAKIVLEEDLDKPMPITKQVYIYMPGKETLEDDIMTKIGNGILVSTEAILEIAELEGKAGMMDGLRDIQNILIEFLRAMPIENVQSDTGVINYLIPRPVEKPSRTVIKNINNLSDKSSVTEIFNMVVDLEVKEMLIPFLAKAFFLVSKASYINKLLIPQGVLKRLTGTVLLNQMKRDKDCIEKTVCAYTEQEIEHYRNVYEELRTVSSGLQMNINKIKSDMKNLITEEQRKAYIENRKKQEDYASEYNEFLQKCKLADDEATNKRKKLEEELMERINLFNQMGINRDIIGN